MAAALLSGVLHAAMVAPQSAAALGLPSRLRKHRVQVGLGLRLGLGAAMPGISRDGLLLGLSSLPGLARAATLVLALGSAGRGSAGQQSLASVDVRPRPPPHRALPSLGPSLSLASDYSRL